MFLLSTEITKPLTCDKNKMFYFCHCGASSNENVLSEDARSPLTPVEIVAFLLRFLNSLYLVKVYRDSETATAPYCMLSALNKLLFPIRRPFKKSNEKILLLGVLLLYVEILLSWCQKWDDLPHLLALGLLLLQIEADLLLQLEADLFDRPLVWSSLPLLAEGRQPEGPIHLMLHP